MQLIRVADNAYLLLLNLLVSSVKLLALITSADEKGKANFNTEFFSVSWNFLDFCSSLNSGKKL